MFANTNANRPITAIHLNTLFNTSDARKIISVLREKGMNIKDKVIDQRNGTKIYWYAGEENNEQTPQTQLNF